MEKIKVVKKRLLSGRYVWLERIDENHGLLEFASQGPIAIKDPGTYAYDQGGPEYREACDLYRQVFKA